MRIGNHLGTSYQIWNGGGTWFWLVTDPSCRSGAIGAAANEADAIRDAHWSIEEMTARSSSRIEAAGIDQTLSHTILKCAPPGSTIGWNHLLANLELYLRRWRSEYI
jgi:hypothetical protein